MTSPRVMRAMASPTVGHLDPLMVAMLDDIRAELVRLFRAPEGSFAFAVSGTGTSGMETAVANIGQAGLEGDGRHQRLFRRSPRADVRALRRDGHARQRRVGGAFDPDGAREIAAGGPRDVVAMVHARDVDRRAQSDRASSRPIARKHDALTIVDAVTSFGAIQLEVGGVGHRRLLQLHAERSRRAVRARAGRLHAARRSRRSVKCRSFYFDLRSAEGLLDQPQVSPHDVVGAGVCACTKR